jgi:hypothetical protein
MVLLVEDGTGLIDSESYISVDYATTYHAERGHDAWTDAGTDEQEAALRRATEWIDITFRDSFIGYRKKLRAQALEWPRTGAVIYMADNGFIAYNYGSNDLGLAVGLSDEELPGEILRATAEAALRELAEPGVLFPDVVPGRIIKSVSVTGAVSVTYADSSPQGQRTIIPIIGAILFPLLVTTRRGNPLVGSSERV